jgi:hypothetical protein
MPSRQTKCLFYLQGRGGAIALAGMWLSAKFIVKRNIGEVLIFLTIIGRFCLNT